MAGPLNPMQMETLLHSLAKQLRCDPNYLRQQLQSGNINGIASSLDSDSAKQLQALLKNPRQLQQVMNSPEMKELLRKIQSKQL